MSFQEERSHIYLFIISSFPHESDLTQPMAAGSALQEESYLYKSYDCVMVRMLYLWLSCLAVKTKRKTQQVTKFSLSG